MISRSLPLCLMALAACAIASPVTAADPPKRVVVGKYISPTGLLVNREPGSTKWNVVKQGDDVYSGDMLVGKPPAIIVTKNGAVRLALLADLGRLSEFPILEPAVVLHASDKFDLDFTLDRGRVVFTNSKKEGAANVQVRFRAEKWDLKLAEPEARVGMEIYGRWPRGVHWKPKQDPEEAPTSALHLMVLHGEVDLKHGKQRHAMHAPPGPAFLKWDSIAGSPEGIIQLQELPDWANPKVVMNLSQRARMIKGLLDFLGKRQAAIGVEAGSVEATESEDPTYRRIGLIALGAIDDLPSIVEVLRKSKDPQTRDDAVSILRHWIGRGPGQDRKVYDALLKKGYTPVQAQTVLHLLHSFGAEDLNKPETYETLIAYLKHKDRALRFLAEWHLTRLVPEGQKIKYDPNGSDEEIDEAIKEWKKLVPDGQLPPKPKDDKKDKKKLDQE